MNSFLDEPNGIFSRFFSQRVKVTLLQSLQGRTKKSNNIKKLGIFTEHYWLESTRYCIVRDKEVLKGERVRV